MSTNIKILERMFLIDQLRFNSDFLNDAGILLSVAEVDSEEPAVYARMIYDKIDHDGIDITAFTALVSIANYYKV